MNKSSLAIASLSLYAASVLADAPAEEPHVQMVWVWVFVALFLGSIVLVGWMMWRSERADRIKKDASGDANAPSPAGTTHKS